MDELTFQAETFKRKLVDIIESLDGIINAESLEERRKGCLTAALHIGTAAIDVERVVRAIQFEIMDTIPDE